MITVDIVDMLVGPSKLTLGFSFSLQLRSKVDIVRYRPYQMAVTGGTIS